MNSHVVKRIFIGMILILIGTLFLGSQLGFITIEITEIASTYWPVILILLGISGLIGQIKQNNQSYFWNLFILALGVGFLGRNLNIWDMSIGDYIKLLIPAFIILFGIGMMFKKEKPAKNKTDYDYSNKYQYNYEPDPSIAHSNVDPLQATATGIPMEQPVNPYEPTHTQTPKYKQHFEHSYTSDQYYNPSAENRSGFFGDLYLGQDYWELKPMNISHFIGDTIIDLTKAQIPIGDTKLNISAFIGDVKVFVPNDMEVEVSVTSSSFLGDSTVFDKRENGFMRSVKQESQEFILSDKKIRIQVNLFIGDITVQRVG